MQKCSNCEKVIFKKNKYNQATMTILPVAYVQCNGINLLVGIFRESSYAVIECVGGVV